DLPIGTAYAVWVGIGACGTAVFGILRLGESASAGRLCCLALLIVAVVGLKLTTPAT
ncbi:MAG TPA: SMR family transporter, partial [Planctomycetota bacterium]|nr:SMR family transporter [Planctomycetota bacterium]